MTEEEKYDVVVIGAGPGGYVAAIKAAQLGMKVASIEEKRTLGGTCLNEGCIPSKALLNSSELYEDSKNNYEKHGIEFTNIKINLERMMQQKNDAVSGLCKGIEALYAKNKIVRYTGKATVSGKNEVKIILENEEKILKTKNIIIATGSVINEIEGIKINEKNIISSKGALELPKIPETMVVIGAGYIGLELGSVWRRLGSKVIMVEYSERIVPALDLEISAYLQKSLTKQGLEFKLGYKVLSLIENEGKSKLEIENIITKEKEFIETEIVLVSIGRKANSQNLGLEALGVEIGTNGKIKVDKNFRTKIDNIFAIGDVIDGPMLAHKAEEEGVAVAEIISGQAGHVNYDNIPAVIYTYPEVAYVGMTEEQVKSANIDYKVGKFPFTANSRARTNNTTEGMVKIISATSDDRILGAHIIGSKAGSMISEMVLALEYKASSEDVARTCHPHPTESEAIKEACMAVYSKPIHM